MALVLATACSRSASNATCPDPTPPVAREIETGAGPEDPKGRAATGLATPTAPSADDRFGSSGMLSMIVIGVLRDGAGQDAVVLVEPRTRRVVPIWIGPTEAMAIALRLSGERYPRPLTHDLLDKVLGHASLQIVRVEIDALEDSTFLAHLFLSDRLGETTRIDARPSDAIALAIGADAPVFMAVSVVEQAGHTPEELGLDPANLVPPAAPSL